MIFLHIEQEVLKLVIYLVPGNYSGYSLRNQIFGNLANLQAINHSFANDTSRKSGKTWFIDHKLNSHDSNLSGLELLKFTNLS